MTGAEHYREAERLLKQGTIPEGERDYAAPSAEVIAAAQVHATLALASATAERVPEVESSYHRADQWDLVLDGDDLTEDGVADDE